MNTDSRVAPEWLPTHVEGRKVIAWRRTTDLGTRNWYYQIVADGLIARAKMDGTIFSVGVLEMINQEDN